MQTNKNTRQRKLEGSQKHTDKYKSRLCAGAGAAEEARGRRPRRRGDRSRTEAAAEAPGAAETPGREPDPAKEDCRAEPDMENARKAK